MSSTLGKNWEPGALEAGIYEKWVQQGFFTADPQSGKPAFSIVMPPPNVNGNLHLGHAFGHVISDIICRYRRANGYDVLWLPGTDHAGIATQIAVEKNLAERGLSRLELGREEFLRECFRFVDTVQGNALGQMRRFGDSVDWSRLRFTLDEQLSQAVRTIFKQLYDAGLIYRAERLVNWSPALRTAVSDLEVVHKDIDGELVSFRYNSDENSPVVATTRLETLLGDTAIAVHPDDERYKHLIGTSIAHPFVERQIPIIADDYVDPEFGSGAVKITPAHDPNDYEIGKRHQLPMLTIMDHKGHIADTGTEFDGMDRFAARKAIRHALYERGQLVKVQEPYNHAVAHSERSGEPIEPRLSMQWWVKVDALAKASGDAVRSQDTVIYPQSQTARWFDWVDNMHDWCISRQLWWGHQIPVWYGPDGQVLVPAPGEEIPAGYVQDEDVLDTWFSSALFPFSTMGWPENTTDLERYYPTSLLTTGYDILFFWVARMMMFAQFVGRPQLHTPTEGTSTISPVVPRDNVPFKNIFLHGLVRDEHGRKMSKSKGNGIDPMDWIEEYGIDATRFALARGANPGSDHNVGPMSAQLARNFVTKIYNATKFAMMNGATVATLPPIDSLTESDRWILTRLQEVISEVDKHFATFSFGKASDVLYHFAWDELCDWYVEIAKVQVNTATSEQRVENTKIVLGVVFDTLLRLLHPYMPFVTEVLWQHLTGGETIVTVPWPDHTQIPTDSHAVTTLYDVQKLITEIRRFRSDQGIKPSQELSARITGWESASEHIHGIIASLAKISTPAENFTAHGEIELSLSAGIVSAQFDTSGAIDIAAEKAKLEKELQQARKDLQTSEVKLNNPKFVENAPENVVNTIRARFENATAEIARIEQRLSHLQ